MVNTNKDSTPNIQFVDSHCHIDFAAFDDDREDVIDRAYKQGVKNIIVPAVSAALWSHCITVCQAYAGCHLALGMHPLFIDQHQPQHLTQLDQLIVQQQPIAVGEIGLDFYQKDSDREKQRAYFHKQLIIAKRHHLPVIIHNRKAHDECLEHLREINVKGGIIHAFNGSLQQAEKYIELGFLLGFGGMLTFQRSTKLRALAKAIKLKNIVLETDAPDMTVVQHRGMRNSPEHIPYIAQSIADIKNTSVPQVADITTRNIELLFGLTDE